MRRWRIMIGPAVIFILWAVVTATGMVKPLFLPSPGQVLSTLMALLAGGDLWGDAGSTLWRTGAAFLISAVIGTALGVPLGIWSKFYESLEVVFDFFRSMPSTALLPLAMLLFGLGDTSRIAVAAFTCSLVNAIQTAYAVRAIPRHRILAAKLFGARGFFLLRSVHIPSVLPGLVAGWRITLSLSLILIVVSEMFIGTRTGLGMRIYDYHLMFRSSEMYAVILVVGLVGYGLNKLVELAEHKFVHWAGK